MCVGECVFACSSIGRRHTLNESSYRLRCRTRSLNTAAESQEPEFDSYFLNYHYLIQQNHSFFRESVAFVFVMLNIPARKGHAEILHMVNKRLCLMLLPQGELAPHWRTSPSKERRSADVSRRRPKSQILRLWHRQTRFLLWGSNWDNSAVHSSCHQDASFVQYTGNWNNIREQNKACLLFGFGCSQSICRQKKTFEKFMKGLCGHATHLNALKSSASVILRSQHSSQEGFTWCQLWVSLLSLFTAVFTICSIISFSFLKRKMICY